MGLRPRLRTGSIPGVRLWLLPVSRLVFSADLHPIRAGVLQTLLRLLILFNKLLRSGELRNRKLRSRLPTGRIVCFMRPVRRYFSGFEQRLPQWMFAISCTRDRPGDQR